jgi:hypothetical protein
LPNLPTLLNDSGPLGGLRRRSARSEPQIPQPIDEAHALLEKLEEQAHSGQITEESYRQQADALALTVRLAASPFSASADRAPPRILNGAIAAILREEPLELVKRMFTIIRHPDDIATLEAAAQHVTQNGIDRAPEFLLNQAIALIRQGDPLLYVRALFHVRHPDDFAELQAAQRGHRIDRIRSNAIGLLGPARSLYRNIRHSRAPDLIMNEALAAIAQGAPLSLVRLDYPSIRHPDDLAVMEATANAFSNLLY